MTVPRLRPKWDFPEKLDLRLLSSGVQELTKRSGEERTVDRSTRAVVNPKAVAHTIVEIRKGVGARRGIMAVVKADGYGHGAVKVSLTALKKGANCLGVAIPEEASPQRGGN
jgi:hypothetical protein